MNSHAHHQDIIHTDILFRGAHTHSMHSHTHLYLQTAFSVSDVIRSVILLQKPPTVISSVHTVCTCQSCSSGSRNSDRRWCRKNPDEPPPASDHEPGPDLHHCVFVTALPDSPDLHLTFLPADVFSGKCVNTFLLVSHISYILFQTTCQLKSPNCPAIKQCFWFWFLRNYKWNNNFTRRLILLPWARAGYESCWEMTSKSILWIWHQWTVAYCVLYLAGTTYGDRMDERGQSFSRKPRQ